jgi:hypothetical protein
MSDKFMRTRLDVIARLGPSSSSPARFFLVSLLLPRRPMRIWRPRQPHLQPKQ